MIAFSLASSYQDQEADPISTLRENPFNMFLNDQTFQIMMTKRKHYLLNGTSIPKRMNFYQGLFIEFDGLPRQGDKFTIDGNLDGIGDNANMIAISELEKKKVFVQIRVFLSQKDMT